MTAICRTCLAKTTNSIDLSQSLLINGENIDLFNMLSVCTGLEVEEIDDELTHQICFDCMNQTTSSYTFRQKALKSNSILKESEADSTLTPIKKEISLLEPDELNEQTQELSIDFLEEIDEQEIEYLEPCLELEEHLMNEVSKTEKVIENELTNSKKIKPPKTAKARKKYVRKETTFVCPFCGKSVRGTGNYKVHVRTHTGEKPYKCDLCSYKCGHPTALKLHKASHSSEKPLVCQFEGCTKAFKTPSHLAEHRRVHGPPQFECGICTRKFHKRICWNDHMKAHNLAGYLKCDFCERKFSKKSNMRKHQQTTHPELLLDLKDTIK